MTDKNQSDRRKELRKEMLALRRALTDEQRAEYSARVVKNILASDEFKKAQTVLIYKAMPDELSLDGLLTAKEAQDKNLLFPLCTGPGIMEARMLDSPNAWISGSFGITEPDPKRSKVIPPEEIDLVICPCSSFDKGGNRMGMGGGYYDRYLPKCVKAKIVCAAFEVQKAEDLPSEEWDCKMEAAFTEAGIYKF